MYAFFFIGGVTFHDNKPLKTYICDSIQRLLIPYFVFAFAWDITHLVQEYYLKGAIDLSIGALIQNALTVVIGENILGSNASIGPIWFLYCLLIVRIEYYVFHRIEQRFRVKYLKEFFCIAAFMVGFLCNGIKCAPFKILPAQTAILFFHLGYLYQNNREKLKMSDQYKLVTGFTLLIPCCLSLFADTEVLLISNVLPKNLFLFLVPAVSGTIALLCFSQIIETGSKLLARFLNDMGNMSLIIVGIHSEIHVLFRLILEKIGLPTSFTVIPVLMITIVASYVFSFVFRRCCPVLIGEKRVS